MERWNRCDDCGRFIAYREFEAGTAYRVLVMPDSYYSTETYETGHYSCEHSDHDD